MPWLLPAHVRISAHPDLIAILIEYQLFTYLAGERFKWQAITDRHIFFYCLPGVLNIPQRKLCN